MMFWYFRVVEYITQMLTLRVTFLVPVFQIAALLHTKKLRAKFVGRLEVFRGLHKIMPWKLLTMIVGPFGSPREASPYGTDEGRAKNADPSGGQFFFKASNGETRVVDTSSSWLKDALQSQGLLPLHTITEEQASYNLITMIIRHPTVFIKLSCSQKSHCKHTGVSATHMMSLITTFYQSNFGASGHVAKWHSSPQIPFPNYDPHTWNRSSTVRNGLTLFSAMMSMSVFQQNMSGVKFETSSSRLLKEESNSDPTYANLNYSIIDAVFKQPNVCSFWSPHQQIYAPIEIWLSDHDNTVHLILLIWPVYPRLVSALAT